MIFNKTQELGNRKIFWTKPGRVPWEGLQTWEPTEKNILCGVEVENQEDRNMEERRDKIYIVENRKGNS